MNNIINYFEKTVSKNPNKIAIIDANQQVTFSQFKDSAKLVAANIQRLINNTINNNISLFIDRSVELCYAIMGSVYSGNTYTVLDTHSPKDRLNKINEVLAPKLVITDNANLANAKEYFADAKLLVIEDALMDKSLTYVDVTKSIINTDPLYILFTSGSTGVPKGTVLTHSNVINYIDWFINAFRINNKTIFGSQTPLYFSMSVSDFFATIFAGATYCIIQTTYFTFPIKVIDFINKHHVNTIYWVPSAMAIMANLNMFKYLKPQYLKRVLFAGEVMHNKVLNYWRRNLKGIKYYNLFGPTEATDICCYYEVNRKFEDSTPLPIGNACNNCDCMIVDDNNHRVVDKGVQGELYIRGSFLALGYYKNEAKNKEIFVQNPLNTVYPEIVYKTGDLVKYNEYGEMEFIGRKDFQIKHMGYRIELGEIENTIVALSGITTAVCLYSTKEDKIILVYVGTITKEELMPILNKKLTYYMMPETIIQLDNMPYNQNGKIDRAYLKNTYCN